MTDLEEAYKAARRASIENACQLEALQEVVKRYEWALRIICDIGETRDVEIARKALGSISTDA